MIKVNYVQGDITQIRADAIITPINAAGIWRGGVDRAIYSVAGDQFHRQAEAVMYQKGLHDKQTILASQRLPHSGKFTHVIFVVDELKSPLSEIITEGLKMARDCAYPRVNIPMMRTGVMAGVVEPNIIKVIDEMHLAFDNFEGQTDMEVNVVVYNDPTIYSLLLEKNK